MNLSAEHTKILNNTAQICLSKLIGKQNAIIRFVWCCVDKIHLCSSSLKILIPLIEKDDTLEFSVGII